MMPPGTYLEQLPHPGGEEPKELEIAIFKEHRFAFYFWNRWKEFGNRDSAPSLATIDWHRDLAPPSAKARDELDELDLSDPKEIAEFMWSDLDTHNDSHLLSAAYLNLVGDVCLLKNYGTPQESDFTDSYGNRHRIREFTNLRDFEDGVLKKDGAWILDIDLDFFVKGKVQSHQLKDVHIYGDREIGEVIDGESPLFRHLFPRLEGITIATEPRYCGGILKSNHILKMALRQLLTEDLRWKHLE